MESILYRVRDEVSDRWRKIKDGDDVWFLFIGFSGAWLDGCCVSLWFLYPPPPPTPFSVKVLILSLLAAKYSKIKG